MKLDSALLVEKVSEYEYYKKEGTLSNLMPKEQEAKRREHENHAESVSRMEKILKDIFKDVNRIKSDILSQFIPGDYDLAVTGGGDATFIGVAAMLDKGLILGGNTTPSKDDSGSYGGLCTLTSENLGELYKLKSGDFKIQKWLRLEAMLNGQKLPYVATNEIAIGDTKGYRAAHLRVDIDDVHVGFTGSGLVACTPMGSTAWYSSITEGHVIDPELYAYGLAAREVFLKREKPAWQKRTVAGHRHTIVTPTRDRHLLTFDALEYTEQFLKSNDKIEIYISDKSLNVVTF